MKKIGFILILTAIIIFSSCSLDLELVESSFAFQAPNKVLSFEEKRAQDYYLSVNIKYPQLLGEREAISNINQCLFYIPFDLIGYEQFLTEELAKGEFVLKPEANGHYYGANECEYEVLCFDGQFLSVEFEAYLSNTVGINIVKSLTTFDLSSGELLSLTDYCSLDKIQEMISLGKYEVCEGQYLPGGWIGHELDLREDFLNQIEYEWNQPDSDPHRIVNTSSIQNFGLTEDKLLIKFGFEDSLNGYVVLEFEREDT